MLNVAILVLEMIFIIAVSFFTIMILGYLIYIIAFKICCFGERLIRKVERVEGKKRDLEYECEKY